MSKQWDDMPDILNAEDLASMIGCNKYLIYQKARNGELPTLRGLGRLTRFSKAQVRSFLEGDSLAIEERSQAIGNSTKELRWL